MNDLLSCYRVRISARSRQVLTWTTVGADQKFPLPIRSQVIILAAIDEDEAIGKAQTLGAQLMGGRSVNVEWVEFKCAPRTHTDGGHHHADVLTVRVEENWDWLKKFEDQDEQEDEQVPKVRSHVS